MVDSIHDELPKASTATLFHCSVAVEEGGRHVHVRGAHEGSRVRGRREWLAARDDDLGRGVGEG